MMKHRRIGPGLVVATWGACLSVVGSAPAGTGHVSGSIALERECAYCASAYVGGGKLFQYRVAQDGTLQALKPPYIVLRAEPRAPFVSPNGLSLYLPLVHVMLEYRIGSDGRLNPLSPPSVPTGGVAAHVFARNGRFLYVAYDDRGFVYQYAVSPSGALQPLAPPRIQSGHGGSCQGLILSPDGRTLYSLNYGCTIGQFRVGKDGRLSALSQAALPAAPPGLGFGVPDMVLSPGGKYAYAIGNFRPQPQGATPRILLTVFRVGDGGVLRSVSAKAVPMMGRLQVHGRTLFAWREHVDQYRISADGNLAPGGQAVGPREGSPFTLAPSGRYAYQVGWDDMQIHRYRCRPDGGLEPLPAGPAVPGEGGAVGIYIDPSGRFLYTETEGLTGREAIGQFRIDKDGQVTPLNPPSVPMPYGGNLVIVRLPARATSPAPKAKARAGTQHKPAAKTKGKAPAKKRVKGKD